MNCKICDRPLASGSYINVKYHAWCRPYHRGKPRGLVLCPVCGLPLPTSRNGKLKIHPGPCQTARKKAQNSSRRNTNMTSEAIAKKRLYAKNYRRKLRTEIIEHYGSKCACCGEDQLEFLAIDHINGGGNQHRKRVGFGNVMYLWIKRDWPNNLQILCHNCNLAKGYYGKCPHRT